jgi:hypothetical protein
MKEFEGVFKRNDAIIGTSVSVYAGGFSLGISAVSGRLSRKKSLDLYPFNIGMLTRPFSGAEMKKGFFYSIKGTKLGAYMEKDSGPPEPGNFYCLPINEFQIHAQYTPDSLVVTIECTSEIDASDRRTTKSGFEPCTFHVCFKVPKPEMKEFLEIGDHNFSHFEEKLNGRF